MNDLATAVTVGAKATLAEKLVAGPTSFTVHSGGSAFPASSFHVVIGDELIFVGSRSGNTFAALMRGEQGTRVHPRGAEVLYVKTGAELAEPASPGGSGAVLASTPVVINNAGIIALPTTNVPEVLAAPGSGKVAIPVAVQLVADFTTAGYGGVDANSDLGIYWDNGSSSVRWGSLVLNNSAVHPPMTDLTNLLATTPARKLVTLASWGEGSTDDGSTFTTYPHNVPGDLDVMEDTHLILYVTNGADFNGGNAANTLTVTIQYVLLDV